jgi:ribonuclease inhibitor
MRVVLNGNEVRSESDFHDALAVQLDFGPYYGRNLDALWDRLSADVERPVELVWKNSTLSRRSMGDETFNKLSEVLLKVMRMDESYGWDDRFTVAFE